MTTEAREFYIDWLMLRYPTKARSYFESLSDQELIDEYDRIRPY